MRINTESWFYRFLLFLAKLDGNNAWAIPDNVCRLFWYIVAGLIQILILIVVVLCLGVFGVSLIFFAIVTLLESVFNFGWPVLDGNSVTLAFIGWMTMGLISIVFYRYTDHYERSIAQQKLKERTARYEKGDGAVDLVRSYAKSVKDKVCVRVEFFDPNDDQKVNT